MKAVRSHPLIVCDRAQRRRLSAWAPVLVLLFTCLFVVACGGPAGGTATESSPTQEIAQATQPAEETAASSTAVATQEATVAGPADTVTSAPLTTVEATPSVASTATATHSAPSATAPAPTATHPAPTPTRTPRPTPPGLQANAIDHSNEISADILYPLWSENATLALMFQVGARIPPMPGDGDGIASVDFIFTELKPNGDEVEVYSHTEQNAPFCAFGGDAECPVWVFAQHDNKWPSGTPIETDDYNLRAVVHAQNGQSWKADTGFHIELPQPGSEPATTILATVIRPGPDSPPATKDFVFQVDAFDTRVGAQDGAGIDHVDMTVKDPSGAVVSQRTERTAGYCAFGGGEPDCDIWKFAEHDNKWPNGQPVVAGEYTLTAVVQAKSGQTTTLEESAEIQP